MLPPLSRAVVPLVAAFSGLICATQNGYELAGDEYFFLVAGKHLSWGYADQPPLVAALACLTDALAPGSRVLLRLPMVVAVCVGVLMCAVLAREFGGGRATQLLAAGAFAVSPYALTHSRWVTTDAIDMALWTTVIWLLMRWTRTRDDRLWWAVGGLTALALQGKYLIGVFWAVTAIAILMVGPRELFRRPMVLVAALLAALSTVPSLAWQAQHGWPQLQEGPAIWSDVAALGGRVIFVPSVVASLGIIGTVLFCWGTWWLLRYGGSNRFLGVVIVALVVLVWVLELRRNYLGGIYPLGIAVGAVHVGSASRYRWWRLGTTWTAIAVSAVVLVPALVPVGSGWLGGVTRYVLPDHRNDWNGLASAVAAAVDEVPEPDRGGTVIVAGDYWRSSVLDRLRPAYSLPPVYGDMQGSWFFGPPPARTSTIVYVDALPDALQRQCGSVVLSRRFVDKRTSPFSIEPSVTPIYICSGIDAPIIRLWPELRHTVLPARLA